jgi:hypothetical protein
MRESIEIFNQKQEQASLLIENMKSYWPYGSPMPHTPGYQPVLQTTDLLSKFLNINQSEKGTRS